MAEYAFARHRIDAVDVRVHPAHERCGLLGGCGVAVGGREHELRRALEPAPRVLAEGAVLVDRGHGPRFQSLDEQGAQPTDEHRRIGVDAPRDAVGPEDPCVAGHHIQGTRCDQDATRSRAPRC